MALHLLEVRSLIFTFILAKVNRKNAIVTILAGTQLDSALKLNPLPQIDNCRKMEQGKKKQKKSAMQFHAAISILKRFLQTLFLGTLHKK